jgi:ankyrin repeat protein
VAADQESELAPENIAIARLLLERAADVNAADSNHCTPLMLAARGGSQEMMALLLKAGADTQTRDNEGQTSLMHALASPPRARQLLDKGAQLEARDRRGRTALCCAVEHPYLGTVRLLLQRGANVQAGDDQGVTALHVAVRNAGAQELPLQSLEADAASEQPKYVPAHRLLCLGRDRAERLRQIVRLLVQQGAKIDLADGQGMTSLDSARKARANRLLRELLEEKGDA